jgi:hypothetical protein
MTSVVAAGDDRVVTSRCLTIVSALALAVALAACSAETPAGGGAAATDGPSSDAPMTDPAPATAGPAQPGPNRGSATLTIGDQVYEFGTFDCASGHENTESDVFSFTTNSFQEFDGVRTQMQFTAYDPTSTGRTEGEGVVHEIALDDISNFEDPSISWSMDAAESVSIDGHEVSVSGTFVDGLTEAVNEALPGTLEAVCSDGSRF